MASLDRDVIVWAHWFGPEMSEARRHAVSTWRSSGHNFRLVRAQELGDLTNAWGVKLHPGFDFLTANHKSDYLRSLFMNHEGGVYTDVKPIPPFFKLGLIRFLNSGSFLGGYGERSRGGVSLDSNLNAKQNWRRLVGNGHFAMLPHSEFSAEWVRRVSRVMDDNYDRLVEFGIRDAPRGPSPSDATFNSYPLKWADLQGRIFHDLQADFGFPAKKCFPRPVMRNYL